MADKKSGREQQYAERKKEVPYKIPADNDPVGGMRVDPNPVEARKQNRERVAREKGNPRAHRLPGKEHTLPVLDKPTSKHVTSANFHDRPRILSLPKSWILKVIRRRG